MLASILITSMSLQLLPTELWLEIADCSTPLDFLSLGQVRNNSRFDNATADDGLDMPVALRPDIREVDLGSLAGEIVLG